MSISSVAVTPELELGDGCVLRVADLSVGSIIGSLSVSLRLLLALAVSIGGGFLEDSLRLGWNELSEEIGRGGPASNLSNTP